MLDFKATETELQQNLSLAETARYAECEALVSIFEQPAVTLTELMESYKTVLDADKKAMLAAEKEHRKKDKELRKQLDAKARQLRELTSVFNQYHEQFTQSSVGEPLHDYKQSLKDWHALTDHFPDDHYQDIEGFCKVVDLEEVVENDYSLTPGRYVGYSIQIDEDFDYQGRMAEIHRELAGLNNEANELMGQILRAVI